MMDYGNATTRAIFGSFALLLIRGKHREEESRSRSWKAGVYGEEATMMV